MADGPNQQWRLAARPVGLPSAADWKLTTEPIPTLPDAGVLLRTLMISLDPAMRGWMNDAKSYIKPVGIGEVMRAGAISEVVESNLPGYAPGDAVYAGTGVQTYSAVAADQVKQVGLYKVDLAQAPAEKWLNALGMPGMTGYFGLLDIGQPKAGETVVVSGAAGAVGQTVGQVAKITGCRAVGIAGGAAKCEFAVKQLGYDECIDYKAGDLKEALRRACPQGVDVFFDNVGGDILDTVLTRIRPKARIVICGAISQYNATAKLAGPSNYLALLVNRARMEGMVVFDYAARYAEAMTQIGQWMKAGRFNSREDIVRGIEQFPRALNMLFTGENFGKLILAV